MKEPSFTYFSDVKDGRLQLNISKRIKEDLAAFEGKRVEINIARKKSKRSNQQNRLMWVYATILADEIGMSKNEVHEILKYKFLQKEAVDEKTGEVLKYIGSTTTLTKSEFIDLIDNVIRWAAEFFNVVLPAPNTQIDMLWPKNNTKHSTAIR